MLLRILLEIMSDMVPFMLFVLASTLLLALLFTAATPSGELHDRVYSNLLMEVFRLDFGDFSPEEYSPLAQLVFILGAILVPLVLMNMLIAIMGDTFDRVMEDSSRRDLQELAGLVYKYILIRPFLCCCLKKQPWKYLWFTREAKQEEQEEKE